MNLKIKMCNCGNKRFPMSRSWERPTTPVIKRKKAPKKEEPVIETEALEDKPEDIEIR